MGYFAWQVRFEENVTRFFPDTKNSQNITKVFDNLKIKDKIIILISPADSTVTPDLMIEAGDQLKQNLLEESNQTWIKDIFSEVDEQPLKKQQILFMKIFRCSWRKKTISTSTHS